MRPCVIVAVLAILGPLPVLAQPKAEKGKAASDEERATMETADKLAPSVVSIQPVWDDYDSGVKHEETGEGDRKSTRLNSSHSRASRMPSSA